MSDTISDAIAGLQQRERELELEACAVRARIEEVRELLAQLQHPRRGRPRRRPQLVDEAAGMHVAGSVHGATADPVSEMRAALLHDEPGDVA